MNRLSLFPAASVGLLLLATGSVARADSNWPRWRGPDQNGHSAETNLPVKWSADDILWKTTLPGIGQSSPIIWGDRIFLTSELGQGKERLVFCVDRKTGKILWQQTAWKGEPEKSHVMNGWASASCVTDGEVVVAFFGRAGIHAYTVDGKPLWSKDLGRFESPWGVAACPVLVDNNVIQNCDSDENAYLIALDKRNGNEVWRTKRSDNRGWSTPVLVDASSVGNAPGAVGNAPGAAGNASPGAVGNASAGAVGNASAGAVGNASAGAVGNASTGAVGNALRGVPTRRELVINGHEGVRGYDVATGRELWFCKSAVGRGEPTVTPTSEGLFVVNGLTGGEVYTVRPGGQGDVTETHVAWHTPRKGARDTPSPIVVGDYILVTDMAGLATCYSAKDGHIYWKERLAGKYSGSPTAAGLVYVTNEDGKTFVIKPGPKLDIVAENQLPAAKDELFRATPTPSNGQIFARSTTTLYCIGK